MSTPELPNASPTTSLRRVLLTFAVSAVLVLAFGARGVVHAGESMSDGPLRSVTLDIGQNALDVTQVVHLNWPWDQLETALGNKPQPTLPPLLASGTDTLPDLTRPVSHPAILPLPGTHLRTRPPNGMASVPVPAHPLRRPTPRNPLRLLVTGDSLSGYLGPELINEASAVGPVRGFADTHNGTGLTRPDFVDWSIVAQQQVTADNPDAVVVMLGGNDFQNMTLPGGKFFLAGSPSWTREYQRRAAVCMRIWAQHGTRRVYWLSMPTARDRQWGRDDFQINKALRRAAATVPGAQYVDTLGPITDHGRYADFVKDGHGQSILVREPDGVHLNLAGSTIVAHEVLPIIVRQWHLRYPPPPVHHQPPHRAQPHRVQPHTP